MPVMVVNWWRPVWARTAAMTAQTTNAAAIAASRVWRTKLVELAPVDGDQQGASGGVDSGAGSGVALRHEAVGEGWVSRVDHPVTGLGDVAGPLAKELCELPRRRIFAAQGIAGARLDERMNQTRVGGPGPLGASNWGSCDTSVGGLGGCWGQHAVPA